jgi:hypothetical protein
MRYGFVSEPVALTPFAGPAVQKLDFVVFPLVQALLQQVGKEIVVAIPRPLLIKGGYEEIGFL